LLAIILLIVLVFCSGGTASAQSSLSPFVSNSSEEIPNGSQNVLYGGTGSPNNSVVLTIDMATAQSAGIGPTDLDRVQGIAVNSAGHIYVTDMIWLYRVDAVTGLAHYVGKTPGAFYFALAFDANDVLYGLKNSGGLVTMDPTDVDSVIAGVEIGNTGIVFGPAGMAFDPTNGDLYVAHQYIDAIYKTNPLTAESFLLGFTELLEPVAGLAFDAAGFLYGVSLSYLGEEPTPQDIARLILIDKTTGEGTPIGQLTHNATWGLALSPGDATGVNVLPPGPSSVLAQNTPNPFNPVTTIRYTLPLPGQVELSIYNTLGQRVRRLVDAFEFTGEHTQTWNARDDSGRPVASGVYLYRLSITMDNRTIIESKKMTLLK
jgi:DNA-binding beta-propeller fold protein YncE